MLGVLWFVFLLFIIGTISKVWFKYPIENSLMVGLLIIIAILQIGYMVNLLYATVYLIVFMLLLFFVGSIVKSYIRKTLGSDVRSLFSTPIMSYLLYLIFVWFLVKENEPMFGDELLYWASMPKTLFYSHGALQLKTPYQIWCTDYIPGISLFHFFLQVLNGQFKDGLLYFGYAGLYGTLVLPVLKESKGWKNVISNCFILYFLPLVFFNTKANDYAVFYKSLYVDPIMAIAVAIMIWMQTKKPWRDSLAWLRYVLLTIFIVILKSSGISFVIVSSLAMTLYLTIYEKNELKKIKYWSGLFAPFIYWMSWQMLLKYYGMANTVKYSAGSIFDFSILKTFLKFLIKKTILVPTVLSASKICTSVVLFILISGLYLILYILMKQAERVTQEFRFCIIHTYIQFFIFVVGLYGLCTGPYNGNLWSCERYISTIFEIMICVCICLIIDNKDVIWDLVKKNNLRHIRIYIIFFLLVAIFLLPIRNIDLSKGSVYPMYMYEDKDAIINSLNSLDLSPNSSGWTHMKLLVDETPEYTEDQIWIKQWYGHLRNMLSYELIEDHVQMVLGTQFTTDIVIHESEKEIKLLLREGEWPDIEYILWCHGHYTETPINEWSLFRVNSIQGNEICASEVLHEYK